MDASALTNLYRDRFSGEEIKVKDAFWRVTCRHFFSRFIRESDTVIDVACGFGEFLNHIQAEKKIGVDLNPDARKSLDSNVELHFCSATEMASFVNTPADVVFASNFLEHLPNKQALEKVVDQVIQMLKPEGRFLILGPNLRYLPGKYWDPYDHELGLTHLSLCELLVLKGFEIQLCLDKFIPYTIKSALPTHHWLIWLYIKVPIAWRILGKQFFIVARKPALSGTPNRAMSQ